MYTVELSESLVQQNTSKSLELGQTEKSAVKCAQRKSGFFLIPVNVIYLYTKEKQKHHSLYVQIISLFIKKWH